MAPDPCNEPQRHGKVPVETKNLDFIEWIASNNEKVDEE